MRLHNAEWLRGQARRCARLAATTTDQRTAKTLTLMALEYEREAVALETLIIAEPIPPGDAEPGRPESSLED